MAPCPSLTHSHTQVNNIVTKRLFSTDDLSQLFANCDMQAVKIATKSGIDPQALLNVVKQLRVEFNVAEPLDEAINKMRAEQQQQIQAATTQHQRV